MGMLERRMMQKLVTVKGENHTKRVISREKQTYLGKFKDWIIEVRFSEEAFPLSHQEIIPVFIIDYRDNQYY